MPQINQELENNSDASFINLRIFDNLITDLTNEQEQQILSFFTKKSIDEICFSANDLNDNQLQAYLTLINKIISPNELKLTIESKDQLSKLISHIENTNINKLNLSKLELGNASFDDLISLANEIKQSHFQGVDLRNNNLALLDDKLQVILETLLLNPAINKLLLTFNNISTLGVADLLALHQLKYANGDALSFWPMPLSADNTEFSDNLLTDFKKELLAEAILKNYFSYEYIANYDHSPIPFDVTGTQYFNIFMRLANSEIYKFSNIGHKLWQKGFGMTEAEKLTFANKYLKQFPDTLHFINSLNLDYKNGYCIDAETSLAFINSFIQKNAASADNDSHTFILDICPLSLSEDFIDKVIVHLQQENCIEELAISFTNLTVDRLMYFANAFNKINKFNNFRNNFKIYINDLNLATDTDIAKLDAFLNNFPVKINLHLELPSANMGLMDAEQVAALKNIKFPDTLYLPQNKLHMLGNNLLTFLQNINSKDINIGNDHWRYYGEYNYDNFNDLTGLNIEEHNKIKDYCVNSKKLLRFHYASFINFSNLATDEQLYHAKIALMYEMLHLDIGLDTLPFKLSNQQYTDLLLDFIANAPQKASKVGRFINDAGVSGRNSTAVVFEKEQVLLLANKSIMADPKFRTLRDFKLDMLDYLKLYFDIMKFDEVPTGRYDNYIFIQDSFENLIKYNQLFENYDYNRPQRDYATNQENNLTSYLTLFSDMCNKAWPNQTFLKNAFTYLQSYKIKEEYDIKKCTNMVTWFTWTLAKLVKQNFECKQDNFLLENIFSQILHYSEPNTRVKLSKQLLSLTKHPDGLAIHNELMKDAPQRAILPALILANIIANNLTLLTKAKAFLNTISANFAEGRFMRSFINALSSLAESDIPIERTIMILESILTIPDFKNVTKFIEQFSYALVDKTANHFKESLLDNDAISADLKTAMLSYCDSNKNISKSEAIILKRKWQSQVISSLKNHYFSQQINHCFLLQGLCEAKQTEALLSNDNFAASLHSIMAKLFDLTKEQTALYQTVLGDYPDQAALITYLGKIYQLSEAEQNKLLPLFKQFVQDILSKGSKDFYTRRYDTSKNPHLKFAFENNLLLAHLWQKGCVKDYNSFVSEDSSDKHINQINMEDYLKEKIFLHKHLHVQLPELQTYLNGNSEIRKEIKTNLLNALQIRSLNENSGRMLPVVKMRLQLSLIELIEAQTKDTQITYLRQSISSVNKLHSQSSQFVSDLYDAIGMLSPPKKLTKPADYSKWKIVDTDNFWLLFTCGNLPGSCQRVDGDPELNRSLLGYVIDPKIRLFAVLDENDKFVGRCIAKLFNDHKNQTSVLFIERAYCEGDYTHFTNVLTQFAKARASELNLSLLNNDNYNNYNEKKQNPISSDYTPAPYEYSDSKHRQIESGKYTHTSYKVIQKQRPTLKHSQSLAKITLFKEKEVKPSSSSTDDLPLRAFASSK